MSLIEHLVEFRQRLIKAALAVVVGGLAVGSAPATAAPTKTIEQVQAEVDALEHDAADAAEAWNEARTRQLSIEKSIATLQVRIAAAKAAYGRIASAVDDIALGNPPAQFQWH